MRQFLVPIGLVDLQGANEVGNVLTMAGSTARDCSLGKELVNSLAMNQKVSQNLILNPRLKPPPAAAPTFLRAPMTAPSFRIHYKL